MPDGEFFTGPVEDSVEGEVTFHLPATIAGREVAGVRLRFEAGKVVDASAERGEEFLIQLLDTDAGARRLGELGIGTNYAIDRGTREVLLDEKLGGTVHMALGRSYPESGGVNESAVHTDLVCDLRLGGKLEVDFAQTSQSDGDDKHVGAAYGMGLFEDRAHFTVAYEYENSDPVGCFNARDWCREGNAFYQNPTVPGTTTLANGDTLRNTANPNGQNPGPSSLLGTNVRANQISTTGTFFNSNRTATTTVQGDAAGTGAMAFNLGQQPFSGISATDSQNSRR